MGEDDPQTGAIIGAAIAVSTEMRAGLLESVYEACLAHELGKRGIAFVRQPPIPVVYDGTQLGLTLRADLIVEQRVIVEIKAGGILPVHEAQILTYMRLAAVRKGLMLNFHAFPFAKGIKRFVL